MPKTRDAFALKDFDATNILKYKGFTHDKIYREAQAGGDWNFWLPYGRNDNETLDVIRDDIIENLEHNRYSRAQEGIDRLILRRTAVVRLLERINRSWQRSLKVIDRQHDNPTTADDIHKKYEPIYRAVVTLLMRIDVCLSDIRGAEERYKQTFAVRLREARLSAGLTQLQLAKQLGMTPNGYNPYENAKREPSLTTLVKISKILKKSTDWLLGLE